MDWKRVIGLGLLLIVIACGIYLLFTSEDVMDVYSAHCQDGFYAVYGNNSVSCEASRVCNTSNDCAYLEIDTLPPRVGKCVKGLCEAVCGSGTERPCR